MELEQYWRAIQERVCTSCFDADGSGNCQLPLDEECALKLFLPEIVQTIANVKSDSMEAYINVLRRHVCILCDRQLPDMSCEKRDELKCALDRYYPKIVEAIKSVRAKLESAQMNPGAV